MAMTRLRSSCPILLAGDIDRAVARQIAAEISDGDCLQIGIGGMPNAVCSLLLDSGVKDLGIHTEMLTDGIIDLYKAGLIKGDQKETRSGEGHLFIRARLARALRLPRS